MKISILRTCTVVTVVATVPSVVSEDGSSPEYGADISWPMLHEKVSSNFAWLPHNIDPSLPTPSEFVGVPVQPLGDVQSRYEKYMKGCYDHYNEKNGGGDICWETEKNRIEMDLRQPKSMRNYTTNGYTKIRAPERVFKLLKEFWDKNRGREYPERWETGNIYINQWESPTYFLGVGNGDLDGGGEHLEQLIWSAARDTIEMWTGQKQAECSLYGIRIYKNGSMLAPHVDQNPLVSSAIINVDQDVDEPWPLEVIGHDGKAHNITMEPGDLVLYESHSVIHGRQFPLKGRFMANVFVHFEPIGPVGGPIEYDGEFPPYLIRGSPWEKDWLEKYAETGHRLMHPAGATDAHRFASAGDYDLLEQYLDEHPGNVNQRDESGWTALSEAARDGRTDCVRLLLDRGARVNVRLGSREQDGSILWNAKQWNGEDHEIVKLLIEFGANVDEAPEGGDDEEGDIEDNNDEENDGEEAPGDQGEFDEEETFSDEEETFSDEEETFSDEEEFIDEEIANEEDVVSDGVEEEYFEDEF